MNTKAEVTLEWADGEYLFALKGAQIEELEEKCGNVGIGLIYQRVKLGSYRYVDLYHTIRLGLIGGGMGAVEAKRLVDRYAPGTVPIESGPNSPFSVASAILGVVFHGMEKLPPGKAEAAKE